MQDTIIRIEELSFKRSDRVIFDKVNLNIVRGKITAVMGPSGTGKTTLLKLIGGQLTPAKGRVEINGQEVAKLSRERLYKMRRNIGMLFQSGALFTDINVFDNVAYPLREHTKLSPELVRDVVLMKLEAVGLRGAANLMPAELSGGMARRVALARAIALDPEIILYDEPFAGQDPISMGALFKLIQMLNKNLKMTTVIVSHDVDEVLNIADYVYLISEGKIAAEGTPAAIRVDAKEWVKQFIGGLADGPVAFHYPAKDFKDELLLEE